MNDDRKKLRNVLWCVDLKGCKRPTEPVGSKRICCWGNLHITDGKVWSELSIEKNHKHCTQLKKYSFINSELWFRAKSHTTVSPSIKKWKNRYQTKIHKKARIRPYILDLKSRRQKQLVVSTFRDIYWHIIDFLNCELVPETYT